MLEACDQLTDAARQILRASDHLQWLAYHIDDDPEYIAEMIEWVHDALEQANAVISAANAVSRAAFERVNSVSLTGVA